jgi:predicted Zn-dependent protease
MPNNGLWSKRPGENSMIFQRVVPSLVVVALVSACASGGAGSGGRAPNLAAAMADADKAVLAGQGDKAYAILKSASASFPTEKTPWQRMAQMRYDANNYGEAIVDALEALERDPDDTLSNSIVAVAGLRVSSKALADLTQKNNLSGSVRNEAQDLAKLLRSALGEDVLVPSQTTRAIARKDTGPRKLAAPAPAAVPAPARPAAASSDPFGALK